MDEWKYSIVSNVDFIFPSLPRTRLLMLYFFPQMSGFKACLLIKQEHL